MFLSTWETYIDVVLTALNLSTLVVASMILVSSPAFFGLIESLNWV